MLFTDEASKYKVVSGSSEYVQNALTEQWKYYRFDDDPGYVDVSLRFFPEIVSAGISGGFPFVQLTGPYSTYTLTKSTTFNDNYGVRSTRPESPAGSVYSNIVIWLTFDESESIDDVDLTPLTSYLPIKDGAGTYSFVDEHGRANEEDGDKWRWTPYTAGSVAISENGALWTSVNNTPKSNVKGNDENPVVDADNYFGCRFDNFVYSGSNWSLNSSNIYDWEGSEGAKFSNNSCIPGNVDTQTNFNYNLLQTSRTGGQGVFTTLGTGKAYKYWSYGPMQDKQLGAETTQPGYLYYLNPGDAYEVQYEDPVAELDKWAKDWYAAEEIVGQLMNAGFMAMMGYGAITGNPIDIAMIAWTIGSNIVNSQAENAYHYKGGNPSFSSIGRYAVSGDQLWYINNEATLSSTDGIALMPKGSTINGPYFGTPFNYIVLKTNGHSITNGTSIFFSRLRNGNVLRYDNGDSAMQEIIFDEGTNKDGSNWYALKVAENSQETQCNIIDCDNNSSLNAFLIYESLNNRSFYGSQGDFQLQRVNDKNVVNQYLDYAVSAVNIDDGYKSTTTTYRYGTSDEYQEAGEDKTKLNLIGAYRVSASVSGVTAIYPEVATYVGNTGVSGGYTQYKFHTTSPTSDDQPNVYYQSSPEAVPSPVAANSMMAEVLGIAYEVNDFQVSSDNVENSVQTESNNSLIMDVVQDNTNLLERRGTLTYDSTTLFDDQATQTSNYNYNKYYQLRSSKITKDRFNHSASNNAPSFSTNDAVSVTTWNYPIYTWEVDDYSSTMLQENRLNELYLNEAVVKEGTGTTYIKSAIATVYDTFTKPVGDSILLPNQGYSLINPQAFTASDETCNSTWMSPDTIESSSNWIEGTKILSRDPITLGPVEVESPTGEKSSIFIAYADEDNLLQSYPVRFPYGGYAGVSTDSNDQRNFFYTGFEEYEQEEYNPNITGTTNCSSAGSGISITDGSLGRLPTPEITSTGLNANTGHSYCDIKSTSKVSLTNTSNIVNSSNVNYVLSAWVAPSENGGCELFPNLTTSGVSGNHMKTSDYSGASPDGKKWFYLQATIDGDSAETILANSDGLLSCNNSAGLDDIRLAPVNSSFTASVFGTNYRESDLYSLIARHSDRGAISRVKYDSRRRIYMTSLQDVSIPQPAIGDTDADNSVDYDNQYTAVSWPNPIGFSRWGGFNLSYGDTYEDPGIFNTSIPNITASVGSRGSNSSFYSGDVDEDDVYYLTDTDSFVARFVIEENNNTNVYITWQDKDDDSEIYTLEIDLEDQKIEFDKSGKEVDSKKDAFDSDPLIVTIAAVWNSAAVFADGNLVYSYMQEVDGYASQQDKNLKISLSTKSSEGLVKNLAFAPFGGFGVSYADANGTVVEGHSLNGYKDASGSNFHFTELVSSIFPDGYGRNAVTTKSVEYSSPDDSNSSRVFLSGNDKRFMEFRGVNTEGSKLRNFAVMDWNEMKAVTQNHVISFEVSANAAYEKPENYFIPAYITFGTSNDDYKNVLDLKLEYEYFEKIAESVSGLQNLSNSWQEAAFSFNGTPDSVMGFTLDIDPKAAVNTWIRNIKIDGLPVEIDPEDNTNPGHVAILYNYNSQTYVGCFNTGDGGCTSNLESYATDGGDDGDIVADKHYYILNQDGTAYVSGNYNTNYPVALTLLVDVEDYLSEPKSMNELAAFYSSGNPGQVAFGNSDIDAQFALVSSGANNSPLARTNNSVVLPGAEFTSKAGSGFEPENSQEVSAGGSGSANNNVGSDNQSGGAGNSATTEGDWPYASPEVLNQYQKDPLNYLGNMSVTTGMKAGLRYSAISQGFTTDGMPTDNMIHGFGMSDLWGSPIVGSVGWGSPEITDSSDLNNIYSGFEYQVNKTEQNVVGINYSESRQPNWYQTSGGTGGNFITSGNSYDLLGLWASSEGSDSKEVHNFRDISGRSRIAVVNPQFGTNFSKSSDIQIASYVQKDSIGRTIAGGRLKNVNYGAQGTTPDWQSLARDENFDSSSLLTNNSCKVSQIVYDTYQPYIINTFTPPHVKDDNSRGRVIKTVRYNRETYDNSDDSSKWGSEALDSNACNNSAIDFEKGLGTHIDEWFLYDALGRTKNRYTNVVSADDGGQKQEQTYQVANIYGTYGNNSLATTPNELFYDAGNYVKVVYPDDDSGNQGSNMTVKTTTDRLGRLYTIEQIDGTGNSSVEWQSGDYQLGLQWNESRPSANLEKYTKYDFQIRPTEYCEGPLGAECVDSNAVFKEELAYLDTTLNPDQQGGIDYLKRDAVIEAQWPEQGEEDLWIMDLPQCSTTTNCIGTVALFARDEIAGNAYIAPYQGTYQLEADVLGALVDDGIIGVNNTITIGLQNFRSGTKEQVTGSAQSGKTVKILTNQIEAEAGDELLFTITINTLNQDKFSTNPPNKILQDYFEDIKLYVSPNKSELPQTESRQVCSSAGNMHLYSNSNIAYVRKTGSAYYDSVYGKGESLECMSYDGVRRLTDVYRMVPNSDNTSYDIWRQENYIYDNNGNMLFKNIYDYSAAYDESKDKCYLYTTTFNLTGINNQIDTAKYDDQTEITCPIWE